MKKTKKQQELELKLKKAEEKISELEKKLSKGKKTYVDDNKDQFHDLMRILRHFPKQRYFFERRSRINHKPETIFRLNLLVKDLIEYKAKENAPDDSDNRISMDISSLIKFLQIGRRVRRTKR